MRVLRSFACAFNGILHMVRSERNAKIHLVAGLGVIAAGVHCNVSSTEWIMLIVVMGNVLAAEAFNTSIEILCDKISPGHDKRIGLVKDIAAGGVLLTAIAAAAAGLVVFLPKMLAG